MPLAILVVVLVVSVAAVMLDRIAADTRRTTLQIQEYRDHHLAQGMRRVISAWLRQFNATQLSEMAQTDSSALDITLADGRHVTVSFADGQGTILGERGGLDDENERDEALGLLDGLALIVPDPDRRSVFLRDHGPYRISVNSASAEALGAVAWLALSNESERVAWVDAVLLERENTGSLSSGSLTQIAANVTTDGPARQRLSTTRNGLIAVTPTLWKVRVEVAPARGRPATERYEGLAEVALNNNTQSGRSVWDSFLTWRRAALDDQPLKAAVP